MNERRDKFIVIAARVVIAIGVLVTIGSFWMLVMDILRQLGEK